MRLQRKHKLAMQNKLTMPYLLLRRLFAFLYDCLLLIAVLFLVTGVAVLLNNTQPLKIFIQLLLVFVVGFVYFSWFWRRGGRTLGLQAWKLQLKSDNHEILTWKQCVIRYVSGFLLLPITYITIVFRADRKAVHDLLSNTNISFTNNKLPGKPKK